MSPERTEPQIDRNLAEQIVNPLAASDLNPPALEPTSCALRLPGLTGLASPMGPSTHDGWPPSTLSAFAPPPIVAGPMTTDADPASTRVGRILAGRYRLEARVGAGAMGEVYQALDLRCRRRCAVKLVLPDAPRDLRADRRFWNEAQMAARLHHPNIVSWSEFNHDHDGTEFMVLELLDGQDLYDLLLASGRLPLPRVLEILRSVGSALQYAHDLGIVHRDIKPENIFLSRQRGADGTSREIVKVLDFGLAKLFREEYSGNGVQSPQVERRLTQGMAVGTPAYVPPEIIMGSSLIDGRADQWSLGVVAYQLLSGQLPFEHRSTLGLCQLICTAEPMPLRELAPDLPDHVVQAVARALGKHPSARFSRIHDFVRALDNQPSIWGSSMESGSPLGTGAVSGGLGDIPTQPALPIPLTHTSSQGGSFDQKGVDFGLAAPDPKVKADRPTLDDTLGNVQGGLRGSASFWTHPEDLRRDVHTPPPPAGDDLRATVQYSADELFALAGQSAPAESAAPVALTEETPTTPYGRRRGADTTTQDQAAVVRQTSPARDLLPAANPVAATLVKPPDVAQTVLINDDVALTQLSAPGETKVSRSPRFSDSDLGQLTRRTGDSDNELPGVRMPSRHQWPASPPSTDRARRIARLPTWPTAAPEAAPPHRHRARSGPRSPGRRRWSTLPPGVVWQLVSAGSLVFGLGFLVAYCLARQL